MNTRIIIACFLLLFSMFSIAQPGIIDWKTQAAGYAYESESSQNEDDFTWNQMSLSIQGVNISLLPTEQVPVFVEKGNCIFRFSTEILPGYADHEISYLSVQVDESTEIVVHDDFSSPFTIWDQAYLYFNTFDEHLLTVNFKVGTGITYQRFYDIVVIPASDAVYIDNFFNTLRVWEGNAGENNIPVVFSEGFDAYDTNPQQMYYNAASELMECLHNNGFTVYLLDNFSGTQDIRNNATGFNTAVRFVSSLHGDISVVAGGVSMGGMIARYGFAKAEDEDNPLPAHVFISVDSPQQGAVISQPLQDYKKAKQEGQYFEEHALNNDAAKQLLNYAAYDPDGTIHTQFYNELNALNTDGYPHLTKNVGISFSIDEPNSQSGEWIDIEWILGPFTGEIQSFDLTDEEKVAGSYLPADLTYSDPSLEKLFSWKWIPDIVIFNYIWVAINRYKDPSYIPYSSALDIVNGSSKFDVPIIPSDTYYHDVLPSEVISPILDELLFCDHKLQNQTIASNAEFIGNSYSLGRDVNEVIPEGQLVIENGANVIFKVRESISISDGSSIENGSDFSTEIDPYLSANCENSENFSSHKSDKESNQNIEDEINLLMENIDDAGEILLPEQAILITNPQISSEEILLQDFLVFPNPTSDKLNIMVPHEESKWEIQLFDMMGICIYNSELVIQNLEVLDLSDYPDGIYILKIKQESGFFTKQIVKN